VGELRVAGAEDDVVLDLPAELGLEGGGHVDLGEHAEPLPGQGGADAGDCLAERDRPG
jgi:hypothetical protein